MDKYGPSSAPAGNDDDDEDDDSDDLFGSDESDDEEQERIKQERIAAYNERKAGSWWNFTVLNIYF